MKLFEKLDREYYHEPEDCYYAPYYFRFRGFRDHLADSPAVMRSNGIYALFTEPKPVILKHEIIAGNRRTFYTNAPKVEIDYTGAMVGNLGKREFGTNADHFAPNYRHTLAVGLPGLIEEVSRSLQIHGKDPEKRETLEGMGLVLRGFREMIAGYAKAADEALGQEGYNTQYVSFMAQNCRAILDRAPKSFAEALQLVWFCHLAFTAEGRGAMALGRIDQYLYPFYKKDLEAGILTDREVVGLLENVFIRLRGDVINICIGGMDPEGNCQINGLSRCVLEAVGNCHIPGPNLSLRYTDDIPDAFLDACLKTIGTGLGYPAMMNDRVNIAALQSYGYETDDVYDYCMVGCIENFITGMQPPWTDNRFDTPKFLDYVFNRGISTISRTMGLDTGDVGQLRSMQDFLDAYEKQLAYGAREYVARFNAYNNRVNQRYFPEPFLSCFCHDCIGRGLDINNGGSKYPSVHGACLMGIGTVADSLAAVEQVVFRDREATLEQLRDALNANFEGYEALREKLLAAPKYGNNDPFVDKYAVWFIHYLDGQFRQYRTRDGGWFYIAAAANTANISAGRVIGATPDGRKKGEPLSDAASPTYGRDVRGTTATINSLTKPDYSKVACGTVVNQKFSPSMFSDEKRGKLMALIRTYFKKGGQEIQINATSREVLLDAMEHPEKYRDLVVRVSGFSAYYVGLGRDVQEDILNRTQKE